jgi:diguanylate cyclase (GGDEF)-like protein
MTPGDVGGSNLLAVRRDVLLGAGLLAGFSVVVTCTAWALDIDARTLAAVLVVAASTLLVDLGLLCLPWRRLRAAFEMVFPLVLVGAEVTLALSTHHVASSYTGFFTLAFVYVGLTQDRVCLAILAAVAAPTWILCQDTVTVSSYIRLTITLATWLLVGAVLAARVVSSRARSRELIARANTDGLTGTASRLFLSDQIEREIDAPEGLPSSLVVIDLDAFKNVNDMFGHAVGDELLVAIASRIATAVRPHDTCARLGGDEFAVLLRGAEPDRAAEIAQRILSAVAEPISLSRNRFAVTASIGVAGLTGSGNAQDALRDADVAMYEAKSAGRNRISVFERDMQERRAARLKLESELRGGLERNEFELYYQPVVHIRTGAIIGTEALLRWNHPRRGLLAPDQFLAASEEIGIIVALGGWILRTACAQAAEWQPNDSTRALTMAVNVSGPEMLATDFVSRVGVVLKKTGLPGELLVLEITERMLVSDTALIRDRIEELKGLGVRVAIDDFGTGYSSLAYLREIPVDILKIDQSFVKPLGTDPQAVALLRSIIAIADALKLDIVVEGVETSTHVEILTGLGCEVAQGFHFARPEPASVIVGQLARPRSWNGRLTRVDTPNAAKPLATPAGKLLQ